VEIVSCLNYFVWNPITKRNLSFLSHGQT
jgi:hypothetical protein